MKCQHCERNENPNVKVVDKDDRTWRIRKCNGCGWQDIEEITAPKEDEAPPIRKRNIRDHLKDIL